MKKLFCMCILICLLLTSCGDGQGNLNVFTTTASQDVSVTDVVTDTFETRGEIPEELRVYVPNYTYTENEDDVDLVTPRAVSGIAAGEEYIYYVQNISEPYTCNRLMRLHLQTGEISSPCLDPVCTHNTDNCMFQHKYIGSVQSFGRYIAYAGGTSGTSYHNIYIYDTVTGKVHKDIFNSAGNEIGSLYASCINDDVYGKVVIKRENPNAAGSSDSTIYEIQMWRYNIPSETSYLMHTLENVRNSGGFAMTIGERIYYGDYVPGSDVIMMPYSMRYDQTDIREEPYFQNGYYYTDEYIWNAAEKNAMICISMKTGEIKTVIPESPYTTRFTITNNYVYYHRIVPFEKDGPDVHELWRCDHTGENAVLLHSLEQSISMDFAVKGKYLYTLAAGKSGNASSMLVRIDVETGEILYIE